LSSCKWGNENEIGKIIVDAAAAVAVHRELGPGLSSCKWGIV
jgi:hypothetical protein